MKKLLNRLIEQITPYVQKIKKHATFAFIAHVAFELIVTGLFIML